MRLLIYRSVLFRCVAPFNCRVGFLQGAKLINLQRAGLDPDPILLSYIPALDVIREICKDVRNKTGFIVKPEIKVKEVRRSPTGRVEHIYTRIRSPVDGHILGKRAEPGRSLQIAGVFGGCQCFLPHSFKARLSPLSKMLKSAERLYDVLVWKTCAPVLLHETLTSVTFLLNSITITCA
jgi:hypothetical protein